VKWPYRNRQVPKLGSSSKTEEAEMAGTTRRKLTAEFKAEVAVAALEPDEWKRLMDWEELACRSAGVVGAGTHIIAALRTPLEVDRRIS
jgi:hypothetical protein